MQVRIWADGETDSVDRMLDMVVRLDVGVSWDGSMDAGIDSSVDWSRVCGSRSSFSVWGCWSTGDDVDIVSSSALNSVSHISGILNLSSPSVLLCPSSSFSTTLASLPLKIAFPPSPVIDPSGSIWILFFQSTAGPSIAKVSNSPPSLLARASLAPRQLSTRIQMSARNPSHRKQSLSHPSKALTLTICLSIFI